MGVFEDIIKRAKDKNATIVLPETDIRVLEAATIICNNGISNIILIGKKEKIDEVMKKNNLDFGKKSITIVDNLVDARRNEYANNLYNLRKDKGMTSEEALKLMDDPIYFATMMVKMGEADGMVGGANHTTPCILRPALQIIKKREDLNTASSFFLMQSPNDSLGKNRTYIFADCGLVENPTAEQYVDIAIESAKSFKLFVNSKPKVAFLSYSTKGSANSVRKEKIIDAIAKIKEKNLNFDVDGELQLDAAIIPEVASIKAPNSEVAGNANVLIFPDLESGNIGYKLVQRFGNAIAIGPITQGLNKPVNDLSRGCSVNDIVLAVAMTCIQVKD